MFAVLPTQPRYPGTSPYGTPTPNGNPLPTVEPLNTISYPTGPEYQFLVSEGTYTLRYDLHIAYPPAHPSEGQALNLNPLSTTASPPTTGTKVSLVSLAERQPVPGLHNVDSRPNSRLGSLRDQSLREDPREGEPEGQSHVPGKDAMTQDSQPPGEASNGLYGHEVAPAFGEGNALLVPQPTKDSLKRRKPKNNIIKSNSSFVSRVVPHDNTLSKRLQERDLSDYFAFVNINRAFQWLDLSSPIRAEFLTKIMFTKAHALCHNVNDFTKSTNHLDVIIGFSTGDIIWYEAMSQKYARLNKNGAVNASPVSEIRWIPGSENLFLAAHMDGSLIVYDKEKEDAPFAPEELEVPSSMESVGSDQIASPLLVNKSVNSKNQKSNPVACWKLSNQKINAFAFSPDCKHLAVVSEDGYLRIIDYLKEQYDQLYVS
ncbi:MAG: hypothetical protein M1833_001081 [Piccolia ochrophora]|nr:MAG: hypothetical protein M1833_001081 [Piccolia ochrophora]